MTTDNKASTREQELRAEISKAEEAVRRAIEQRDVCRARYADETSPFKIGDIIEFKYGSQNAMGVVTRVFYQYGGCAYDVTHIRKDGTMTRRAHSISQYDNPRKPANAIPIEDA